MPVVLDTNSKYCVQIEQFEGPLDLLLHLVREAKLDITEISLAVVANQYFEYLERMKSFNIEIESSYLLVFAQLLELKSRLLLPPDEEEYSEPSWDSSDILDQSAGENDGSEEVSLVKRLSLYAMVSQATDWLGEREELCLNRYVRSFPQQKADVFSCELQVSLESLASAFQRLSKAGRNVNRPITLNRVSVSVPERIEQLSQQIKAEHIYSFWGLIGKNYSRPYVVVTFLALLQMVKEGKLHVDQIADCADLQIYI